MGLEHKRSLQLLGVVWVTIPHGGLRTEILKEPLEPLTLESPSHTVGSERYLAWEVGTGKTMSPSHAVGLEHHFGYSNSLASLVTIPHSGLGTIAVWAVRKVIKLLSPSHTVGLEQSFGH